MTLHHFFNRAKHAAKYMYAVFLDELFPKTAEIVALESLTLAEWREHALRIQFHHRMPWCMSITHFAEPAVRLAIHQMKFHNNIHVAKIFAQLLDESVAPFLAADTGTSNNSGAQLIIPIPISWTRRNDRGYNQVELVLAHCLFPHTHGWNIAPHLLQKRPGRSQTTQSSAEARQNNMRHAFSISSIAGAYEQIRNADIILIDDVVTTGATLSAARDTLLAAGARSVQAITLATG